MDDGSEKTDPHAGQPVLAAGAPLDSAAHALLLVHGRGGSAEDMLGLARVLNGDDFAILAPQAAGHTWYPYGFMAPVERNEPWLSSALRRLADVLATIADAGIPPERTVLLGFSQGACLTLEFVARHARRYGGVAGLSGGLIGAPGTPRDYAGSLEATPVFLGTSDPDPHIPVARVDETAEVLRRIGAVVDERVYPAMGHTVNEDEIEAVRRMLEAVRAA